MGIVQRHVLAARVARLRNQATNGRSSCFCTKQRRIVQKGIQECITNEKFVSLGDICVIADRKLILIKQSGSPSGVVHISALIEIGAWQ